MKKKKTTKTGAPGKGVKKPEDTAVPAKYVFLDVVDFTGRSVEVQALIVDTLNEIVRTSLKKQKVKVADTIFLPTGDGICVALLDLRRLYDVHMKVALSCLTLLDEYNANARDDASRFHVRIGINENVDNLVIDINGKKNIVGAGINLAQRVMDTGDGAQIMLGDAVFQVLVHHHEYMHAFRSYSANVGYGASTPVHQMIKEGTPGLNTDPPSGFEKAKEGKPKFSKLVAYYFAHSIKNQSFLMGKRHTGLFTNSILLYFLAIDSIAGSEAGSGALHKPEYKMYKAGEASLDEQFKYYNALDPWVAVEFSDFIRKHVLLRYSEYLPDLMCACSTNEKGKEKLKREWPDIWEELELDSAT